MSTDLTAAIEHLHEIRDTLDKALDRLAGITEGLREEAQLPEPESGTHWLDANGNVWSRRDERPNDLHRWVCDSRPGRYNWDGVLLGARPPLVQLVRADQTVVLPSVVPPAGAAVEAKASARQLTAWLAYDETCVKFEIRNTDEHACWQILLAGNDAERWLLDVPRPGPQQGRCAMTWLMTRIADRRERRAHRARLLILGVFAEAPHRRHFAVELMRLTGLSSGRLYPALIGPDEGRPARRFYEADRWSRG